jgi:predicted TIM-barrel fold metal-dependent hydrolase
MSEAFLPPVARPKRPGRPAPPNACDCHVHIFGPYARFPLEQERSYAPPELPAHAFLAMIDAIGFTRGVLVQASAYGTDNRAMLNGLSESPQRLRGVAVTTRATPRAELADWRARGVCALRFTDVPPRIAFAGTVGVEEFVALAPLMRELDLHAQLWMTAKRFTNQAERLFALGVPLVLDHMAILDPAAGLAGAAFQAVLRGLGEGRFWLKLTPYRLSRSYPDYEDIRPFHEALVRANPERLVWGSDWPHVHMASEMPDDGHLVDLFDAWTGDDVLCTRILAENPAHLYGF